jgi:hypothetical protein
MGAQGIGVKSEAVQDPKLIIPQSLSNFFHLKQQPGNDSVLALIRARTSRDLGEIKVRFH